ncbi:RNA-directed DNA polymerase, eukaryota, reverse transcriptase zinc-binding domain protein [Tanacetum coccineum]
MFISNAGLEEVPLGGCSFTWCHKSATKMSKLDRFLIYESLLSLCPNISAVSLDRYLSDHRPILMRESYYDYGPVPFRFFHYWFDMEGFDKLVEESWKAAPVADTNVIIKMMKKLKYLKEKIRIKEGDEDVVNKRTNVDTSLQELEKLQSVEVAQKAKIKWAIEGDENSKRPTFLQLDMNFPNILNSNQQADLECEVTKDEIKRAVWDCGTDKSRGPEGFTFYFYRRYWKIIESDVVDATHDANKVKDFRPISLIGSLYKIIAKLLVNRLVVVLGNLVNESKKKQSLVFKVDFEKAYDLVRWDYLDDILRNFGLGDKWRVWIQNCLRSYRGSVIVNGSPTEEFQIYKGLKQGDPLSPFLFILVMESLQVSFQKEVEDAVCSMLLLLNPSLYLSHMFYADDAIFVGQWNESNINTIVHILDRFLRASMLRINISKSKLLGHSKRRNKVGQAARKIGNGADTLFWEDAWRGGTAFKYLFPKVYALESSKNIDVASKMAHCNLGYSFRRDPRGGVEKAQFDSMLEKVEGTLLADMRDRWTWSLEGSGDFSVASVRKLLDGNMLPEVASKTRWIKAMLIKVNVHAWRVKLDCLPTRINISRRGMEIESIICPMAESSRHIFFSCRIAREILRKISRWWDVSYMELFSYEEWLDWILNIRISVKHKQILEGVCYAMWWHIWNFRNKCIFDSESPSKAIIFEDVVSRSFYWCRYRCKGSFSWIEWLKNPHLLSL